MQAPSPSWRSISSPRDPQTPHYLAGISFIHLLAITTLSLYAYLCSKQKLDLRYPLLLLVTTTVAGPFGAAATATTILGSAAINISATPFGEWLRIITPGEHNKTPVQKVREHINKNEHIKANNSDPAMLLEQIAVGTHTQKRTAITEITQYFVPAYASALHKATQDSDKTIRVLATTAIAKIENAFAKHAAALSEALGRHPGNAALLHTAAKFYDMYAHTQLFSQKREQDNRKKALEYYSRYILLYPEDSNAQLAIGRLLLRCDYNDRAADWFENALEEGTIPAEKASIWYMESLFHLQHYDKLRQLAHTHAPDIAHHEHLSLRIKNTIESWAGTKGATA